MTLILEDLPGTMDARGWHVAARLMRRWFNSPPWGMESPDKQFDGPFAPFFRGRLDEQIVTMAWARRFRRIGVAMNTLQSDWSHHSAGLDLLRRRVREMQAHMPAPPWVFGNLRAGATVVEDTCQIRRVKVGSFLDPADECRAALADTNLKLGVSGMVEREGQRLVIYVKEIGHYLKDSYDFLGPQFLGIWDRDGLSRDFLAQTRGAIGTVRLPSIPRSRPNDDPGPSSDSNSYEVRNEDFRQWRIENGCGGDFWVFSDVAVTELASPIRVVLE